ncbi:MAG: hypothetical protein ABWK01_02000 [Infirmifilum sp.]
MPSQGNFTHRSYTVRREGREQAGKIKTLKLAKPHGLMLILTLKVEGAAPVSIPSPEFKYAYNYSFGWR